MTGIVTRERAAAYVAEHCPNRADVSTLAEKPGSRYICGCGRCLQPDPTPAELQRQMDEAAWQRAASTGEGR